MKNNQKVFVSIIIILVVAIAGYFVLVKNNNKWPLQKNTANSVVSGLSEKLLQEGYKSNTQDFFDRAHMWWISDDGLVISTPNSASFEFEIPNVQAYKDKEVLEELVIQKVLFLIDEYMQSHELVLQKEQSPSETDINDIYHMDSYITKAYFDSYAKIRCRFGTVIFVDEDLPPPYTVVGQVKCVNDSQFMKAYDEQAPFMKVIPETTAKNYTVNGKEIQFFERASYPCSNNNITVAVSTAGMTSTQGYVLQKKAPNQWVYLGYGGRGMDEYCNDGSEDPDNVFNWRPYQKDMEDISSWKTYTDSQYGFEIKYPSNWFQSIHGPNLVLSMTDLSKGDAPTISINVSNGMSPIVQDNINNDISRKIISTFKFTK